MRRYFLTSYNNAKITTRMEQCRSYDLNPCTCQMYKNPHKGVWWSPAH